MGIFDFFNTKKTDPKKDTSGDFTAYSATDTSTLNGTANSKEESSTEEQSTESEGADASDAGGDGGGGGGADSPLLASKENPSIT